MKKGFGTPTISSVNKNSQEPASLRDKILKLSSAVKELKSNAIQEDSYLENLQQSNMKNYNNMNNQLTILKKSFNSLSDILLNEMTNMGNQFGSAVTNLTQKIDLLEEQVHKQGQISNQNNVNYLEVEEELSLLLKQNKDKEYQMEQMITNASKFQAIFEKERDEQKLQFEKFKIILQNNQNQIDFLNKDKSNSTGQLSELKAKVQSLSGAQGQNDKNLLDLEEQLKISNLEINTKLTEIRTQAFTQKDTYKNEQVQTLRELSSVIKTIEEKLRSQDETIDSYQRQIRNKTNDMENQLSKQTQEFQQDLQELASIYKESSSSIIVDFDKAVNNQHNEMKFLNKKLESIENKFSQFLDDIQLKITKLEIGSSKWKDR